MIEQRNVVLDPDRQRARREAERLGMFWLPCPRCGRFFGGHEWKGRLLADGTWSAPTVLCFVVTTTRQDGFVQTDHHMACCEGDPSKDREACDRFHAYHQRSSS